MTGPLLRTVLCVLLLAVCVLSGREARAETNSRPFPETSSPTKQTAIISADIVKTPIDRNATTTPTHTAGNTQRSSPLWTFGTLTALLAGVWIVRTYVQRREASPRRRGRTSLVQVVESTPVDGQLTVHVLRVGSRALIVGSSAAGLTTLSELTDPVEVADLLGSRPDGLQTTDSRQVKQTSLFRGTRPIRHSTGEQAETAAPLARRMHTSSQRLTPEDVPPPLSASGEPTHV